MGCLAEVVGEEMTVIMKFDREREIRINNRAVFEAETLTGKDLQSLLNMPGLIPIRALLWGGLRHEDRTLSLSQIDEFMDTLREEERLEELHAALQRALIEGKWIPKESNREG